MENSHQENAEQRNNNSGRNNPQDVLNLDLVLSTQPELGPSVPDGGYGWVVFIASLFFQATIPCLIINFGIFLAYSKLVHDTQTNEEHHSMNLWDDPLMRVPLWHCISQAIFDPLLRLVIWKNTWPQLVATSGTCLTCAGLVFVWMGMTSAKDEWLFIPAGVLTGMGSTLILAQSEILLGQYFRLKLNSVNQICQLIACCGFILGPIFLGENIMKTSISHVLLWYQAIVLQGLIIGIAFRKPRYLKSKFALNRPSYQSVAAEADEEEDIFSKNSRELQVKRHHGQESTPASSSATAVAASSNSEQRKNWEKFDDDEEIKYVKLDPNKWEKFDSDENLPSPDLINNNPLSEELASAKPSQRDFDAPIGLFTDSPVNNNNSYAYDDEIIREDANSNVFMPANSQSSGAKIVDIIKEPTFYKSLMMICSNRFSLFIFYALFPTYLFLEINSITLRNLPLIVGCLCLIPFFFQCIAPWILVGHNNRAIVLWIFSWLATIGYFMVSDFRNESVMLFGATKILLSICILQHVSKPLHPISLKLGVSYEYILISVVSGIMLTVFTLFDATFKDLFRTMAIIYFFIGTLWLSNYIYKRLRVR